MNADAQEVQRILVITDGATSGLSRQQVKAFAGQLLLHMTLALNNIFKLTESEPSLDLRRLYLIDPRAFCRCLIQTVRIHPVSLKFCQGYQRIRTLVECIPGAYQLNQLENN